MYATHTVLTYSAQYTLAVELTHCQSQLKLFVIIHYWLASLIRIQSQVTHLVHSLSIRNMQKEIRNKVNKEITLL